VSRTALLREALAGACDVHLYREGGRYELHHWSGPRSPSTVVERARAHGPGRYLLVAWLGRKTVRRVTFEV